MSRLIAVVLAFCASVVQAGATQELQDIIRDHWAWTLQESPETRSFLGDHSADDRWSDLSLDAFARRDARREQFLSALAAVPVAELGADDKLNHAMLNRQLQSERTFYDLGLHLMTITMRDGPQFVYTIKEFTPFKTAQDYRRWLGRMAAVPTLLAQHRELLSAGVARQRVQAREVMERLPNQFDQVITEDPADNPFYQPFLKMPSSIAPEIAEQLRSQARELIAGQLTPAYREFRQFFVASYLPHARVPPGIGSLPEGREIYRFLARDFTTTELTPEQIHATGKREVARILTEMQQVRDTLGFSGTAQEFNTFLRTDPQFYYASPEALLEAYRAICKRIDPELVTQFGKLPRTPYGVTPISAETAPDTTTAYYMQPAANGSRAGFYYVNLYRPEVRPKYEMEVLSVHEAVPGHHLQIALAQELEGIPMFRKEGNVTAFVEGWGLYSERLGYQLGLYQDPYSRYGQLIYDMWRAVRLVVDTGMHYFDWSRDRAIDYFKAHAAKSEADIVNEIDRYIGWPGQALAYKIGQLKMLELRERAESTLGKDFDIRAFHDHLLGAGALPLDVLEQRMEAWIDDQQ